jgi:hypothetical protein
MINCYLNDCFTHFGFEFDQKEGDTYKKYAYHNYLDYIDESYDISHFALEYDQRKNEFYAYREYLDNNKNFFNEDLFCYSVKNNKVGIFKKIIDKFTGLDYQMEVYIYIRIIIIYGTNELLKIFLEKLSSNYIQYKLNCEDFYDIVLELNRKEMLFDLFYYLDNEYNIKNWVNCLDSNKLKKFLKLLSENINDKRVKLIIQI